MIVLFVAVIKMGDGLGLHMTVVKKKKKKNKKKLLLCLQFKKKSEWGRVGWVYWFCFVYSFIILFITIYLVYKISQMVLSGLTWVYTVRYTQ